MRESPEVGNRIGTSPAAQNDRSWETHPILPVTAFIAFALPLILYLATLAPSLLNDDPAEYQSLLPVLGVAHPTGYPLYTLLGHLFTVVFPVGEMALRVNLFSALAAAAASATCFLLLRALSVSTLLSLPGAFALAVASDQWSYATIAQTYALNALLIALALFACLRAQRKHNPRSLVLLAFSIGLGVAHHSTFWLLAPALAVFFIYDAGLRSLLLGPGKIRLMVTAAIALVLPLTLYAYIPLRGDQLLSELPGAVLGVPRAVAVGLVTPHYLAGWTNVVFGSFYGASTLGGAPVDWPMQIGDYLAALHVQFHGFEILALGLFAPSVWRRNTPFVLQLLLAWITNIVVVARGISAFDEPAGGLYTPTYLFCIISMVLVLDSIARSLAPRMPRLQPKLLSAAVLAILVAWSMVLNFPSHDLRSAAANGKLAYREWATRQLTRTDVQKDAVVLGAWSEITPLHYVQLVDGVRPDVIVIQAPLAAPAGRELIVRALNEGHTTYLAAAQQPLMAVAFKDAPQPRHMLKALFGGELSLLGYDLVPDPSLVDGQPAPSVTFRLYWHTERQPGLDYKVFVHLLDTAGNQVAGADHSPVSEYFPTSSWPPGFYFVDTYGLPVAPGLRAVEVGLYVPMGGKRLSLPDGGTSVHIDLP